MNIRAFECKDVEEVKRLHAKYFPDYDFPDFLNYICAFVIEDDTGIVTAGGVRDIAECVAVTNMSLDPRTRIQALYKLLDASTFVCRKSDFNQMYVWSRDPKYTKRLMKNGFRLPDGQSLILDL